MFRLVQMLECGRCGAGMWDGDGGNFHGEGYLEELGGDLAIGEMWPGREARRGRIKNRGEEVGVVRLRRGEGARDWKDECGGWNGF